MRLRRNYPLTIGLVLSAISLFIAIFGPAFAPQDPLERFSEVIRIGESIIIPSVTPVPPFSVGQFPLGTDNAGRDVLSRVLWAVRPTLITCFAVTFLRLLVGVPLGLLAGWYNNRWIERLIGLIIGALIAIPPLMLAIALIALSEEKPLSLFIAILALIGWTDIAIFVKSQTQTVKQAEYIESSRALGSGTFMILRRHVFPQLWPSLPILIAFELSAVLLIMAELGFLGFFVGDGFIIYGADPNSPAMVAVGLTAGMPELGQMLSDFWSKIFQAPWEMVVAASAIFLQVFAFNMLGEGLRRRMDITR
ncbi:MAG: ABC transporter permease [Anaerolineales bacterium]|nr:ABC transporter permease [Anaerolineales bacterium]